MHFSPSIVLLLLVLQCRNRQVSHHTELPRTISFVEISSCLRICTSDNFLAKIRSFKNTPLHQGHITVILLTLLLCGDVEPNPGPRNDPVYPCGCCERKVNWSHKAICCDSCSLWYHKSCISMCSSDFDNIGSVSWHCFKCNCPIQDSFTFHYYNLQTSNSFNPLLSMPSDVDGDCNRSCVSAPSPRVPVRHSSPFSTNHRHLSNFSNISTVSSPSSCARAHQPKVQTTYE